ncbi:MAG: hypothetical protein ACT452_11825 [Microthrixaceae bacterium]
MKTLAVHWIQDGNIHWEDWWVKRYGRQRTRIPGEAEHVSFANFDLKRNGLPSIRETRDGLLYVEVHPANESSVKNILSYHGFETIQVEI